MNTYELELRRISRILAEIAHTLETSDNSETRVVRVLALARDIVPSRRCALLEIHGGHRKLFSSPPLASVDERIRLEARLSSLYELVAGGDEIGRSAEQNPSLALPVMGLDEIIGVVWTEPDGNTYDARHLRLLSVIGAQLGSYLSMVQLRTRDEVKARELTAAHDFQRVLAGVVGHDLRNPLAVIQAIASQLLLSATDERQVKALHRALHNVEHATTLITDLVDVTESRVTGTIRVQPTSEDLREIVEITVEDLRHANPTRQIHYTAPAHALTIPCDKTRIAQIVTNLVNNAFVHGDRDEAVKVELSGDAGEIVLTVQNRGPVISSELLPNIFDPFKQGSPQSRPHSVRGLGLGLYIVDRLARGHGGRVEVKSTEHDGTVFTVRFPRAAAVSPEAHLDLTHRGLVLIVDDDADVCDTVASLLEKRGYSTTRAANGQEALEQLRAGQKPNLVLVDVEMPVMGGEAFCAACAADPELAQIPIVVISSDTTTAVRLAATSARAYLSKPVPVDRLIATIESVH